MHESTNCYRKLWNVSTIGDIRKSEYKTIHDDKWRFDFRENGYVIISIGTITKEENDKEVIKWTMRFHGVDLHTCITYIFKYYGEKKLIHYEDLEDEVIE